MSFTLCNASTCKSWNNEVSSLIEWFAKMTDKTPKPWCLHKTKGKLYSISKIFF